MRKVKQAGKNPPLCNWCEEVRKDKDGKKKAVIVPRTINEIVADIRKGFDGFPKRLGDLFFFDETSKKIVPIPKSSALSAWIQGDGDCTLSFRKGLGYVTLEALHERLHATAQAFTAAASVPFWPKRVDVFDMSGDLPKADTKAEAFWKLMDFLCPASEHDRLLMAAAFIAPLYYSQTASRPAWCIDTVDAQGSGKSTVVKLCARLYGCAPIDVDFATLKRDETAFKKRVVSSEGRQSRIALIDNITGDSVASASLAKLITAASISERAAYGRGESSRENDLTWFLTMNGASFDADMASRCYTLRIRKPVNPDPFWEEQVFRHIDENRLQILSDMAAMLDRVNARPRSEVWVRRESRFARFDSLVLAAVCRDRDEFDELDHYLSATATETNVDQVAADTFAEAFAASIRENYSGPGGERWNGEAVVVTPANIDAFLKLVPELAKYKARDVRQWVKADMIPDFDRDFDRLQNSRLPNQFRARGSFCYRPKDGGKVDPLTPLRTVKIVSLVTTGSSNYRWDVIGETRIST